MATKIPAAQARMFRNVFVCRNCGQKIRSDALRIINKQVKCRKCGKKSFRPVKSKRSK